MNEKRIERFYGSTARWLAWKSFRMDARKYGADATGWRRTNALLFAVCAVIVYLLLLQFYSKTGAVLGAMAFMCNPITTSTTASVSGRFGLLCGVFYFGALLCAVVGGWLWLLVPALVYGAWACKEEAVVLPFAIAATLLVAAR